MTNKEFVEILKDVKRVFTPNEEFICNTVTDVRDYLTRLKFGERLFHEVETIDPKFKGEYWNNPRSDEDAWWNTNLARKNEDYEELIKLKVEFIQSLIDKYSK